MFAFFWGALGLLWIQVFYPLLSRGVERIPKKTGIRLTWILVIFMIVNMAVSGLLWRDGPKGQEESLRQMPQQF